MAMEEMQKQQYVVFVLFFFFFVRVEIKLTTLHLHREKGTLGEEELEALAKDVTSKAISYAFQFPMRASHG